MQLKSTLWDAKLALNDAVTTEDNYHVRIAIKVKKAYNSFVIEHPLEN
jgi:hypothetical protein